MSNLMNLLYGPLLFNSLPAVRPFASSMALYPSTVLNSTPLRPYTELLLYVPSRALRPLYGVYAPSPALSSLSLLRPSIPLTAPLQRSVPSMALYLLYGSLFLLRSSVPSTALCPLYGPLSPLQPSVPSTAHCPLYGPLSPVQPSVPSTPFASCIAVCPLYGPLSP
jgi:hypothetical protein